MSTFLIDRTSSTVFPRIHSVATEEEAMAEPQPNVLNWEWGMGGRRGEVGCELWQEGSGRCGSSRREPALCPAARYDRTRPQFPEERRQQKSCCPHQGWRWVQQRIGVVLQAGQRRIVIRNCSSSATFSVDGAGLEADSDGIGRCVIP